MHDRALFGLTVVSAGFWFLYTQFTFTFPLYAADRFRVTEWLPDDPYPQALVETLDDEPNDSGPEAAAAERRTAVERLLRQVLALQVELGFPAPSAVRSLDDDPATAAFEAALLSPIGPMDAQKVLEAPGTVARLALLETLLDDARDLLARRIAEN